MSITYERNVKNGVTQIAYPDRRAYEYVFERIISTVLFKVKFFKSFDRLRIVRMLILTENFDGRWFVEVFIPTKNKNEYFQYFVFYQIFKKLNPSKLLRLKLLLDFARLHEFFHTKSSWLVFASEQPNYL